METLSKKKDEIWQKARSIEKKTFLNHDVQNSNDEFRLDDLGAIIKYGDYGTESKYGWNIDHILPIAKGGTDDSINLQVLHWKNNKAKGDDFPTFKVAVCTRIGNEFQNDEAPSIKPTLHDEVISALKAKYPGNKYLNNL